MKHTLTLILLCLIMNFSFAQAEWCATDQMLEEWFENHPEDRELFLNPPVQEVQQSRIKGSQNNKAPNYIIPVVVHVIHFNGDGNISKEQIEDGIKIINDDFNKLNSDTANVRSPFKSLIADSQIEFRLAQKDPSGKCTDGINLINSFQTYNNRNQVKSLSYWDANKYFNVWIVNTIQRSGTGNILGFAQFPRFGANATYGIVVREDEWGSIGSASSKDGRTVTHEMGHCFDLLHTFQGGCGFNCATSGDRVCDTPPQASSHNNSCDTTLNSCSNDATGGGTSNPYTSNVKDQLENYMGYGLSCLAMFTEGQKTRMESALTQVSKLVNLTRATNLTATGTNNGYLAQQCAPVADFYSDLQMVCVGGSISFTDDSYRDTITTYTWSFPGGTPSTSSAVSPSITYNTPGIYDVELKVENAAGADSMLILNQVIVNDTMNNISGFGYFEGFENASSFADWTIISPTGNPKWVRTGVASYAGNSSALINNYIVELDNINAVQFNQLISPPIDVSQVINPSLRFKIAYKAKNLSSEDRFKIALSTDCGASWSSRFVANPAKTTLISSGRESNNYIPISSDWKTFTLNNLTPAMRSSKNLLIRFDLTSGDGNNMFIDDVEVVGASVVGIDKSLVENNLFLIYPNPTDNGFYIEIEDSEYSQSVEIFITNILGKRVKEVSNQADNNERKIYVGTSDLSPGIYFVSYQNGAKRITKKLIVNRL